MDKALDKNLEKGLAALEAILREQLALHEQMLAVLLQKKSALARADHAGVTALLQQENRHVQTVSNLEKTRLALVGDLTLLLDPGAAAPLRLPELAERLPEPARGRLLVLRGQVRQRMERVRDEAGLARRATESLVRHMHGLVQSIGSVVTGVGTYGRAGAPPRAALAISTFNTTA
jgi:hypothetical protein